jgi:hypothetical protein
MAAKDEMGPLPHYAKNLHAMHVMLGKTIGAELLRKPIAGAKKGFCRIEECGRI